MNTKKHTAAVLVLMLVGLTGLVSAQTATFKAQVPFAFVANGETMPAGECIISAVRTGRTMLSISRGKQHVFVVSNADGSPNPRKATALVFHQYGDQYFLAGIKREGGFGYALPASKLENELRAGNVAEEDFTLLASAE